MVLDCISGCTQLRIAEQEHFGRFQFQSGRLRRRGMLDARSRGDALLLQGRVRRWLMSFTAYLLGFVVSSSPTAAESGRSKGNQQHHHQSHADTSFGVSRIITKRNLHR